nr:MAG TPA: hypothetical protein [Caudoviricetes sp.]
MTRCQRFKLNRLIETNRFNISDKDMLMYYKAYIKIYTNWEDIVDRMDVTTLSSIYPRLKKYPKNILKLLQIYCRSDIIYSIEIVKAYGADVGKLLLEY